MSTDVLTDSVPDVIGGLYEAQRKARDAYMRAQKEAAPLDAREELEDAVDAIYADADAKADIVRKVFDEKWGLTELAAAVSGAAAAIDTFYRDSEPEDDDGQDGA